MLTDVAAFTLRHLSCHEIHKHQGVPSNVNGSSGRAN